MTKYRSVTECAYVAGYRAARIERKSYNDNDYSGHYDLWKRHGHGRAFAYGRWHLWQRIDYEYHSAWWTPARLRYELWCEKQQHGGAIPF